MNKKTNKKSTDIGYAIFLLFFTMIVFFLFILEKRNY